MNFYQEITIIDHAEISPYFIWSKVYGQLHIALADSKGSSCNMSYGVSFPEYYLNKEREKFHLGKKLRIFASSKAELETLNLPKWLVRLADYVHIKSIHEVPKGTQKYAIYKRKHVKGENRVQKDIEQYATYYAKQHSVSYEDALELYSHMTVREINLPFIQMESLTNQQRFRLFIEKQIVEQSNESKKFTTYGLSSVTAMTTVPEF